jgi:molecular chaperone GrpE
MVSKAKFNDLKKQVDELTEKWKRALADYQNLEKRVESEKKEFVKFSNASLIDKLLGVLDDFERAQKHLKDKGLEIAINQFKSVLQIEGVEEIKTKGKEFEPMLMDCIEVVRGEENKVVEVLEKGYLLNQKVLRPAKVKVGQGKKGGKK